MRVCDLPPLARKKLSIWNRKQKADEVRKRIHSEVDNQRRFRRTVSESIRLLEDSKKSLSEPAKQYSIDPCSAVKCNTIKLEESKAINMLKIARTAGHFGVFSPCGIASAKLWIYSSWANHYPKYWYSLLN